MFVENYRRDFYDLLRGERVLMLPAFDVDSVATVKTLQYLFTMDNIAYTLIPISGYEELKTTYLQYSKHMKMIILINCGGAVDILHLLGTVPSDAIFFIIDSHRPFSLLNIYDETRQVRILGNPDHEKFPTFDEVFMEMSDDEDEEVSDDDSENENPPTDDEDDADMYIDRLRAKNARRAEKRADRNNKERKRREFEDSRNEILLRYSEYNYYGKPAAMVALNVTLDMSRANSEVVWWAIIGVTDCVRLSKIDKSVYTMLFTIMQEHVNKVAHENENTLFNMKIAMTDELDIYLYRNWSLYESMRTSPNWVCTFKMWSVNGDQRFKLFLAESGLPLVEVRQEFQHMNAYLKKELKEIIRRREDKYNITDWIIATFEGTYGHTFKYTALDTHMAALSSLDATSTKLSLTERFQRGLDCLTKEGVKPMRDGVALAKSMLISLYKQMRFLLSVDQINVIGTLIIASIGEARFDFSVCTGPNYMTLLVRFIQRAYITNSRSTKHKNMPFVLIAPLNEEHLMAIGVPPFSVDVTHNLFGRIFEQVASKMQKSVRLDYFDSSMCQLKSIQKEEFIENLVSIMS